MLCDNKLSTEFPINLPKVHNKTKSLSGHAVKRKWIVIDASNAVLGRLAAFIAFRLRGKARADYTPNVDCGDNVVVLNADKVVLTGKKEKDKCYYRHTGHPGGIKMRTASMIRHGKRPQDLVILAVKRMLSKGPLANRQLSHLKVYCSADNPHVAQSCEEIDFVNLNRKNVKILG